MFTIDASVWVNADSPAEPRLRGADSVYAAVALTHRCTLVSLDGEHLTRLASVVPTVAPADALARLSPTGSP